jgi:hypothetical protein
MVVLKFYGIQTFLFFSAVNLFPVPVFPTNFIGIQVSFDRNVGLLTIAPCKVITLNPLCIIFGISSLLPF